MEGELGAGKTVFTQGFAKALKIKAKIKSPTFVLMKHYPIPDSGLRIKKTISNQQLTISNFYHLDCYRLKNYKDLLPLGRKEKLLRITNKYKYTNKKTNSISIFVICRNCEETYSNRWKCVSSPGIPRFAANPYVAQGRFNQRGLRLCFGASENAQRIKTGLCRGDF